GATTDYKVLVSMTYDRYGRRTGITDVSAGVRTDSLLFNPDGSSVSWHTNPNGQIITFSDRFGRVTRVERPGVKGKVDFPQIGFEKGTTERGVSKVSKSC
ncbi:MAG: hypothetical protein II289_08585, partial [Bacteroidales bacterium]|nr:hypothetical protein [Bacteroidales bacterium]